MPDSPLPLPSPDDAPRPAAGDGGERSGAAVPAPAPAAATPTTIGVVGWGLCAANALFFLLWAGRLFAPGFLEGPLVPCVALSLLPGTLCALLFRSRFCFTLYRVFFAIALVVYLIEKKTLDPRQIGAAMTHWQYVLPGALCLATPIFTGAWRWRLLLRGQGIKVGFWALARLLTASYFFNTFIPGANGGDIFRLFTMAKKDRLSTAAVTTSVVLDHFLGMPGLMLFVLAGVALNFGVGGPGEDYQNFHALVKLLGIFAAIGLIGFFVLLGGSLYLHALTSRLEARLPGGRGLAKITAALSAYRRCPGLLAAAGGISLLMHLATLAAFVLFGRATGVEGIPCSQYMFLVFGGLAANYLPLAPGGVGVGEMSAAKLFCMAPPFLESNGAHAATMMVCYRAGMLLIGLVGGWLYACGRHDLADHEIEEAAPCANS